jgi:hypothetical protein
VPCLPEVPACCWDEPCQCQDCACAKCVYTSLQAQLRMCACACACTHLALALAFTLLTYTRHVLVVVVRGVQHVGNKLLLTLAMSDSCEMDTRYLLWDVCLLQCNPITGPCLSFVPHLRRFRCQTSTPLALLHSWQCTIREPPGGVTDSIHQWTTKE